MDALFIWFFVAPPYYSAISRLAYNTQYAAQLAQMVLVNACFDRFAAVFAHVCKTHFNLGVVVVVVVVVDQ